MPKFELVSSYQPTGDQPTAIEELVAGIKAGKKTQVLLGGTGTGKTFTVSNVIARVNKPTLVLAHNKTLAGQLYSELKEFFPHNRVEYFVSNFDFYQPEAYIPKSDTYIDKTAKTNYEIEMLRSSAMNSLLEREDTIVVASVASIYGLGNPDQYREMIFSIRVGQTIDRKELLTFLVDRQYQRNDIEQTKGTFRVRGDVIEIMPGHTESWLIRVELFGDEVDRICIFDPLTGVLEKQVKNIERLAVKLAKDVVKTNIEVKMDRMNSYERRLVHNRLSNFKGVTTESTGEEPNRCVVIKPVEK